MFLGAGCIHNCFYKRSDCNRKGESNVKFYIKHGIYLFTYFYQFDTGCSIAMLFFTFQFPSYSNVIMTIV